MSIEIPKEKTTTLYAEIIKADPNFYRDRQWTPGYEFSNGRTFRLRRNKHGAYANDRNN